MPTHNRAEYAGPAIEAILATGNEELELVVSDTSDDGRLLRYLDVNPNIKTDRRLHYTKIEGPSNLTKNHNYAMTKARGLYVCLIGDDDGISAETISAAHWASDNNIDVLAHTISANYAWPDFRAKLTGSGHAARLYLPKKLRVPRWRDATVDLAAGLKRALQGTEELPRCYHGIVRRDLLEQIRAQTGEYFQGSSPDMSGAISLASMINKYVEVDYPLSLPGASAGSNSGRSAMNTHKGALDSDSQTSEFTKSGWSEGVPRFFSVETVWAHAGLQSLRALNPSAIKDFNYPKLLALCYFRHPDFTDMISAAKAEVEELTSVTPAGLDAQIKRETRNYILARYKHLLRRSMTPTVAGGRAYIGGLPSIVEATEALNERIHDQFSSFESYIAELSQR
tara:strand:+ start:3131 stop:4318 length:1188 start_codon:yes stop_codon:yes gene_type:complete